MKFPLLFALTLVVTLPSLYVFNALVGSALRIGSVLRLAVASTGVMLAVSASLAPIVVFFAASTTSYPFMKLLIVAFTAASGALGLSFLLRTLERLMAAPSAPRDPSRQESEPGALDAVAGAEALARCACSGSGWPCSASSGRRWRGCCGRSSGRRISPFAWFRARQANFFIDVLRAVGDLLN